MSKEASPIPPGPSVDVSAWTPEQRERFEQELLELFAKQASEVPIPVFLAALTIAALAWLQVSGLTVALWLSAVGAMLLVRRRVVSVLARRTNIPSARRVHLAVLSSVGSGLVHGAAIWLFFPSLGVLERALLTMVMVGLTSGAVAILAGHLPSFAAYAIPVLVPLAGWWAVSPKVEGAPPWLQPAIGVLTLALGVVLARFAGLSQALLKRAFAASLAEEAAREQAELGWREAELQLQRAEAASQSKTRFLSAASHDLRQPLQAMQWLGDALIDADRTDRQRIVVMMNEAIESLEGLLRKLLDRSQLDAGVVRPDVSDFDLGALLEQVRRDFLGHASGKGLTLDVDCSGALLIRSDRTLLLSVLRNLVENAIKYTDRGRIELGARQRGDMVSIRVSDTGRGIPSEERSRVFEEFYQIGSKQRDTARGFGLGLSIVRGYCDLLGIELSFDSVQGAGTTFELLVARAPTPADAATDEVRTAEALPAGLSVLIVEDEVRVLEAERRLLERHGCRVLAARSVAEATEIATADRTDLLVTDFHLPDGTGLDIARRLDDLPSGCPPVLFITGDTNAAEVRELTERGYDCLTKPVIPSHLIHAMLAALTQKNSAASS